MREPRNRCSTKTSASASVRGQHQKGFFKLCCLQTQSTLFFRTRHGCVAKENYWRNTSYHEFVHHFVFVMQHYRQLLGIHTACACLGCQSSTIFRCLDCLRHLGCVSSQMQQFRQRSSTICSNLPKHVGRPIQASPTAWARAESL